MLKNELLELVRAGFTKQEIMELLGKEQPAPQPAAKPEPQHAPQPAAQPEPQPAAQPEPQHAPQPAQPEQQDEQPKLDFNHFLTVMRGEFDGLKKAMQVQNINTAVQPHTKSIDELADDALASIITPKKKG